MKRIIYLFLVLSVLSLASCMSTIHVNIMKPAPITVPRYIKTIAIINRTLPQHQVLNIIEGIVTGEGIGQDKQGVQSAIDGLHKVLIESPRFEVKLTTIEIKGSGLGGSFPTPLPWDDIEIINSKYGTEAVAAIETYDSDFIVTSGSRQVKKKNSEDKTVTITEYYAEGVGTVKMGFRLYDPHKRSIIDQYHFTRNMKWEAKGKSITDAVAHLIHKRNAVNRISRDAGIIYGKRIAPTWVTVSRSYYKKPKKNLEMTAGVRKAQVGDWDGAIESWQVVLNNADAKTAGRVTYNLALANEVLGYLEDAKKLATRSYTEFNNKKARYYVGVLDRRIWDQEKLKEQMEDE